MNNKKLKVYNKKRFISFVILTTLSIITLLSFCLNKVYSSTYNNHIVVTIENGDTLWRIAKENNPNNYDVRKVVYKIMKANKLESAQIKPGDTIIIPVD